jgi:hypothetical protein
LYSQAICAAIVHRQLGSYVDNSVLT